MDPDDPTAGLSAQDLRHVTVQHPHLNSDGTVHLTAQIDLVDALDLDHALRCGTDELKALGSQEPLGARRARALGHLARHQLALDLLGARGDQPTDAAALGEFDQRLAGTAARRLDLHLHFDALLAPDAGLCFSPTGRLEQGQHLLLLDQVRAWMRHSHTEVRILPVIDLNSEYSSDGYTPLAHPSAAGELRDQTCVFPWCSRSARHCDVDHTVPYDHSRGDDPDASPPQTWSSNLGTLCRSHHRLKTHAGWHVEQPESGVFIWTSPHQHRYRRDRHGTEPLAPAPSTPG